MNLRISSRATWPSWPLIIIALIIYLGWNVALALIPLRIGSVEVFSQTEIANLNKVFIGGATIVWLLVRSVPLSSCSEHRLCPLAGDCPLDTRKPLADGAAAPGRAGCRGAGLFDRSRGLAIRNKPVAGHRHSVCLLSGGLHIPAPADEGYRLFLWRSIRMGGVLSS